MSIWEAKYRAVCIGIEDEKIIENATKVILPAIKISNSNPITFSDATNMLIYASSTMQNQICPKCSKLG
jgi:hypothetical protein